MRRPDDFPAKIKVKLAQRAQYICSFPGCNKHTIGPSNESISGVATIGVAAHIHAASPGGKRYDAGMSAEARKDIYNGIWLCQTHATLIDQDEQRYTSKKIRAWKEQRELCAESYLHGGIRNVGVNQVLAVSWRFDDKEPWDLSLDADLPEAAHKISRGFRAYPWLIDIGAAQFLETRIKLFITNTTDASLLVTDLRVQSKKAKPYSGALVHSDTAGARTLDVFVFDLEQNKPVACRATIEEDGSYAFQKSGDFFKDSYLKIAPHDVEGLLIVGRACSSLVEWKLTLSVNVNGEDFESVVSNEGKPFVTSGQPSEGFINYYNWDWWKPPVGQFTRKNGIDDDTSDW
jgi:hypothetical protein